MDMPTKHALDEMEPMSHVTTSRLQLAIWIIIATCFHAGCGSGEVTVNELVMSAAKLEKTKQSTHLLLQDELRRLSTDRALPEQIDAGRVGGTLHPDSLAAKIDELLDDAQTERILKRMPDFFPGGKQTLNAVTLESAAGFLKFYQKPHTAARKALDGPQSSFEWSAVDGWFADTRFTDRATALCGLELIAGIDATTRGEKQSCIAALSYSGRIIRLLAEDDHLTSRLAAADLRNKWLQLVAVTVSQAGTNRLHLQQVYELVMRQMSQWPDESRAWIADRAVGLQTYEMVRQGHYLSLLSKEEVDSLEADGMHLIRARAIQRYVDEDQVFYLDIMRRLIDLQRFPYYQRKRVLDDLENQILGAKDMEKYPQIAAELLLPHTLRAMKMLADDRARCEAWALALASALDVPAPEYLVNPTTGFNYVIEANDTQVQVHGLTGEQWPHAILITKPSS